MRHGTLSRLAFVTVLVTAGGCPGGDGGLGDPCDNTDNCSGEYQCQAHVCVPRCKRAPQCGDGYSCDSEGICRTSTGQPGDNCTSEVDCAVGLSCQINGNDPTDVDENGLLRAQCTPQNATRSAGSLCSSDDDCRNGTCALGRCVDLCADTRDCAEATECMTIPRVSSTDAKRAVGPFKGCLQQKGVLTWTIPMTVPTGTVLLPVPSKAQYASLVFSVDDPTQKVGAVSLTSPSPGEQSLYTKPCEPGFLMCTADKANEQYFANKVRHLPELGQSVLAMPTSPSTPLETGSYAVRVSSFHQDGTSGSAIPHVTGVVKIGVARGLTLHFHFLDLDNHPCQGSFANERLDAAAAQTQTYFQTDFLTRLRSIFVNANVLLDTITYDDILDHPDLDSLDVADAGSLLELGTDPTGVNVFFVRGLSPVGLQAFGPNPGPMGLGGTKRSGIIIGVDTLCYRSWGQLARLTAHELARYMGLYHNVERTTSVDGTPWRDRIDDSDDSASNLMYYSDSSGTDLSPGQREILVRSGVLR